MKKPQETRKVCNFLYERPDKGMNFHSVRVILLLLAEAGIITFKESYVKPNLREKRKIKKEERREQKNLKGRFGQSVRAISVLHQYFHLPTVSEIG